MPKKEGLGVTLPSQAGSSPGLQTSVSGIVLSGLTHRLDKLGAPLKVARDEPVIRVFG